MCKGIKKFPNKVLDMGCSTGISTCFKKGFSRNRSKWSRFKPIFYCCYDYYSDDFNTGIQYYHENAEYTHFKDKSFDFVISNFYFMNYQKKPKNIIEESYRLLNNNGVIAIVDIHPNNLKTN